MYAWPVTLPLVTNREDLQFTLSLFDDDLGTPINLAGIVTANPGQAFTSNAWTVIDGQIATASVTQITIPAYPFGNALSALAITVGVGLAIAPGDPVMIADTLTGQNQMLGYVTSYASATGALVAQIGCTFEFEVRRHEQHDFDGDYVTWWDFGTPNTDQSLLSAQLGNGISFIDVGFVQVNLPASIFQQLRAGTHIAAMTLTDSVNTRQIFVAELPVIYGATNPGPAALTTPASWAAKF